MLQSVTRITPRPGSFSEALLAFRAARLSDCLGLVHGLASPAARTLAARAHLRRADPARALAVLATGSGPLGDRDLGETALLQAAAFGRLGHGDRAAEAFAESRARSISSGDLVLEAEIRFYEALAAFGEGDVAGARESCRAGLDLRVVAPAAPVMPHAHVVYRLRELLGVLDAAEGRYRSQMTHAREALECIAGADVRDVYLEAFALRNLAILARDFDLPDAAAVHARAEALPWTPDVSRVAFTTFDALGWSAALGGDVVESLRRFRRASAAATSAPERIAVSVARASIARASGFAAGAAEEVEHVLELSANYDWSTAPGDYRGALLEVAQVAASVSPARARGALDTYRTAFRMDPTFASRVEARMRAEEAFAHGVVLRAEGRAAEATTRLATAFDTWRAIGYEWRAARAAVELAELGAGEVFRLAVRRELTTRPDSVFAVRARLVA